jgi:hypothetical protein
MKQSMACPNFEFAECQSIIESEDENSIILDIGNLSKELPEYLASAINGKYCTVTETWEKIGLPTILPCSIFPNGIQKRIYCSLQQVLDQLDKQDTFFWVPHTFNMIYEATIDALEEYRVFALDLDSKIDPFFWTKTRDLFQIWSRGEKIANIPAPTFFIWSGNGVHLYWVFDKQFTTEQIKGIVRVLHKIIQYKISAFYKEIMDRTSIVQPFRIPDSKTKNGKRCKCYEVSGGFKGNILDFARECLTDSEMHLLSLYIEDDIEYTDFYMCVSPYAEAIGIKPPDKKVERPDDLVVTVTEDRDLDIFDKKSIGRFARMIDSDPTIIKKAFAMKCIYALKKQAPLQMGCRDLRLFGLSVALGKCGTKIDTLIAIVNIANETFCETPMSYKDLRNCYVDPYKYKHMKSGRLMEYLGISRWAAFFKRTSTMSRSDAGKNAAQCAKRNTMNKIKNALILVGFGTTITQLCKVANVSRQTYFRYRKQGVLKDIYDWYLSITDDTSDEHLKNMQEITGAVFDSTTDDEFLFEFDNKDLPF